MLTKKAPHQLAYPFGLAYESFLSWHSPKGNFQRLYINFFHHGYIELHFPILSLAHISASLI